MATIIPDINELDPEGSYTYTDEDILLTTPIIPDLQMMLSEVFAD